MAKRISSLGGFNSEETLVLNVTVFKKADAAGEEDLVVSKVSFLLDLFGQEKFSTTQFIEEKIKCQHDEYYKADVAVHKRRAA